MGFQYLTDATVEMQTPLQTPIPTPLPGSADGSLYNIPTGNSDYPTPVPTPASDNGGNAEMKAGRPSPYMVSSFMGTTPTAFLGKIEFCFSYYIMFFLI